VTPAPGDGRTFEGIADAPGAPSGFADPMALGVAELVSPVVAATPVAAVCAFHGDALHPAANSPARAKIGTRSSALSIRPVKVRFPRMGIDQRAGRASDVLPGVPAQSEPHRPGHQRHRTTRR